MYPHVLRMNDLYWETLLKAAVPSAGAQDAIRRLREQGIRIGIGTDMTACMQFRKLEVLGLLPYVDFLVSSEEVGAEKPKPAFFARCVEKAGCQRQECLFVGDSTEKDVRGAANAGLQTVWYRPGGTEAPADVRQITNMAELLQIVSVL